MSSEDVMKPLLFVLSCAKNPGADETSSLSSTSSNPY